MFRDKRRGVGIQRQDDALNGRARVPTGRLAAQSDSGSRCCPDPSALYSQLGVDWLPGLLGTGLYGRIV
jgi:hypothetical protein